MAREPLPLNRSLEKIAALQANVERVIRGKAEVVQYCIAALLAKGHILLEDVPGVGKTTLAHALARSLSLSFQRIQFTSDLLPADIVGVTIFNQDQQEFEFVSGPIFTNVLLADEINRATPKSQSALLEAMSEGTITIEKRRMALPDPFLVIATQNPIEHVGTYPLPESQLDRFLMKMTIVQTTRTHAEVALGVSTRGALTYFKVCQALAMVNGRDFVIPEDIKRLASPVLSHRILMKDRRGLRGDYSPESKFLERILGEIPVPR